MTQTHPTISVIVPHLNQPDGLVHCLTSLNAQTLDRSMFEIIVVDNGSITLPDAVVGRHLGTRLIQETTPGPGPARNTGVRAARADVIAFIDADCRADPEWLTVALRTIRTAAPGTVLGGDVRIWRRDKSKYTALEAYESVFAYLQKRYIEEHGFSGTGNLVTFRDDFARVGPFGGVDIAEDMDWGRRACALGLVFLYVPDMIIFHPARKTLRELYVKWDRHLQHYANMERSEKLWRLSWAARAIAVLVSPLIDAFKIFASDRLAGFLTRLKALGVLVAIRDLSRVANAHPAGSEERRGLELLEQVSNRYRAGP